MGSQKSYSPLNSNGAPPLDCQQRSSGKAGFLTPLISNEALSSSLCQSGVRESQLRFKQIRSKELEYNMKFSKFQ